MDLVNDIKNNFINYSRRLLIILLILIILFVIGLYVGYVGLGKGRFWEVFNYNTWKHIFDFLK